MKEIITEIKIKAPIDKIWHTLLNFSDYASWNPFIINIIGEPKLNTKLAVTIRPDKQKSMTFKPTVTSAAEYNFSWRGRLIAPGIFDGQHSFQLTQTEDNHVLFLHKEVFSGILSKPILSMIYYSTEQGFKQMNQALKTKCES